MVYMISYDIESDKIRTKLAKILEGYGVRIQYSVFECRLSEKSFKNLYKKIFILVSEQEKGSVRFYALCRKCENNIVTIGTPMNYLSILQEETIIV